MSILVGVLGFADVVGFLLALRGARVWSAYPWIFGETFCVVRTMAAETSTNASILTITTFILTIRAFILTITAFIITITASTLIITTFILTIMAFILTITAFILTITAFTVERYVAICHPMRAKTMSSLSRAVKTIVVVWIVAGGCSIPIWIQFGVIYERDADGRPIAESALCSIRRDMAHLQHFFEVSSVVFFIIPMIIISVLYGLIACSIRRSTLDRASGGDGLVGDDDGCRVTGGGRWRRRQRGDNRRMEILRVAQQTRARLAVLKMLGM